MAAALTATGNAGAVSPPIGRPAVLPPPHRFHCRIDDQPGFLVPLRLRESVPDRGTVIVNPSCWLARFGVPSAEVAAWAPLMSNFDWSEETVVVADPVLGTLFPFSFGAAYQALTAGFRPGHAPPGGLPSVALQTLAAARILIAPGQEARRRDEWLSTLTRAREDFGHGYTVLSGLLHPFHLGALRRYYRYLIRTGKLHLGDGQSPRRFTIHNESVTRFFHHQLTPIVSDIAGERVRPSYVYLASYQSGAELPRHTDRPQCDFSISMLIDFTPEPVVETPWPIHLDTPDGKVSIYQALGDSLLYRGRALPHYRDAQSEGSTSTSIFFHYVTEDFDGALE